MTTNFHTAIATGAAGNAAVVEAQLAALDSAITNLLAGSQGFTQIAFGAPTTLTLATGIITVTRTRHLVDTQGGAGTDNLITANGGTDGALLILQTVSAARVVTVKHNTGNFFLSHEADLVLTDPRKMVMFAYDVTNSRWVQADTSDLAFRTVISSTLVPARKIIVPDGTLTNQNNDQIRLEVMPRPGVRSHFMLRASNTTMKGVGVADPTITGTPTASNLADSNYINVASAAVSGNYASYVPGSGVYNDTRPAYAPVLEAVLRTSSDVANIRIYLGLMSVTPTNVDVLAASAVGFRFSTVAGDTNWMGLTNNAGVQSTISTGVVVAVSTVYLFRLRFDPNGLIAYFSVNGSAEVTLNTNLPPNATDSGIFVGAITQAALAKNILISRIYVDHN